MCTKYVDIFSNIGRQTVRSKWAKATKTERKYNHNDHKHLLSIDLQSSISLVLFLLMFFFNFYTSFSPHVHAHAHYWELFIFGSPCHLRKKNCNFWWQETINGECLPHKHTNETSDVGVPSAIVNSIKKINRNLFINKKINKLSIRTRENGRKQKVLNQINSRTV